MKKRQWQSLVLNIMLIFVAALPGTTENFAANQPDSLLSQTLQRGALPVLAALIAIMVVGQLIIFRLDSPEKPHQQWDPARTPYPGLEPFAEKDVAVFFGRDGSIRELIDRLHSEQGEDWGRFVVVAGASGSGKSSLVQAGLIPRLRARRWIVLPVMTPGSDPIGGLAKAVGDMEDGHDLRLGPGALATAISSLRRREAGRFSRIVLIIDQLEELFTLSGRREREFFLSLLKQAVEADNRFWVIAPMRVEYLREFLDGSHASLFGRPMALGAIARADLATVIQEPAALAGMGFEPGLVGRIVADTETSGALPLLAYLLQELYFISGRGKIAMFEDYERLGGVTGALARQADEVVARNSKISVQSILAPLLQFVTIDGNHATRRRVRLDSFTDNERLVVDAFVDARLLVVDGTSNSAVVQVAHEALFRHWAPLRQEVQNRAEFLRQRAELERWAADWENSNRKSDYLLTGERLQLAVLWSENLGGKVPAAVKVFIEYSRNHDLATLKTVAESISEYVLANVNKRRAHLLPVADPWAGRS